MQPEFQKFYVDDERTFQLYEEIQKQKLPILLHCGAEISSQGEICVTPERVLKVMGEIP